jgi:hypothetical protein
LNERQDDFADGDGIFAGLNVHVRHAGRAMVDEQFRDLIVFGAKAFERAIAAAHSTIGAVFAAEIGNFDNPTHKNPTSKPRPSCERSFFMKCILSFALKIQHIGAQQSRLNHCRKIEPDGVECK